MNELVNDRYIRLEGDRACDLATGAEVRLDTIKDSAPAERDPALEPLIEALDHSCEGHPRWLTVSARNAGSVGEAIERIADAAVRRGFITVCVELYAKVRTVLDEVLPERTLLLVASPGAGTSYTHAVLMDAAARSPRPHVLLSLQGDTDRGRHSSAREARVAYGASRLRPSQPDTPEVAALVLRTFKARELTAAGRHAAAERLLRDVVGGLGRRAAARQAARAAITLARLLSERGRSDAAFSALGEAARFAEGASEDALVVETRLWQASVRLADAALVEAEALCRAVLAGAGVPGELQVWAQAVLADALFQQGRIADACAFEPGEMSGAEPIVAAGAYALATRLALANGQTFDAGRHVASLMELAGASDEPLVRVTAYTADLAVLAAAGDLARAEEAFRRALEGARAARAPFRAAWARLIWVDALRRAGRDCEARRHLDRLRRLARVAPRLLRREIVDRTSIGTAHPVDATVPVSRVSSLPVALVRLAHAQEEDEAAVTLLLERLSLELHASRVEVVSNDAGPVTRVCRTGDGLATTLGTRLLEAGFPIGPERQHGGWEAGVPVRLGARLIGAIVCRWPMDRTSPVGAIDLLDLCAAVAAPRLDAWLTGRREESRTSMAVPELVGVSAAMVEIRKAITRAAAAPFAVLIEGESGVGKELAARAVHELSPRRERRFCDVNCAALPEELLESELFGHSRGAFSGAVADRAGLFEDADGGTLFLDEVSELSARAQAKLLRAVQQQEIRRVGESFTRAIDVRIVAAANREMRAEAAAGRFRQDLLYRLDVVRVRIPPLRERPDDIPVLAARCWRAAAERVGSRAELSDAVLAELSRYHWPGNVRELQNVIASLAVSAPAHGRVRPALLQSIIGITAPACSAGLAEARAQFERRFVEAALARAGGNRTRAARSLGLTRQGLVKTLARLGGSSARDRTGGRGNDQES